MKAIKRFFEKRRRNKILLEKAEEMAKFIESIPLWNQGCGHPESRLCDCNSDNSKLISFEIIIDDAEELIKTWKNK